MAFKKKEKEDKFYFTPQARIAFAKEMVTFGFDFDRFLLAKRSIFLARGRDVVAIEYETEESQGAYKKQFLTGSPYFSLEAGTLDWAWKRPYDFWMELRRQSASEESKKMWECDRLEETRTGKTKEVRARELMQKLSVSLQHLVGMKKL